jgi:large subunit ribosomal protein L3
MPRRGSMQFWPRVRAKNETPRVRSYQTVAQAKPLGFAGYKAGMTQVSYVDNAKTSLTKGQTIVTAATIIECPPIHVVGARLYKTTFAGTKIVKQINGTYPTDLKNRLPLPKKESTPSFEVPSDQYDEVRLLVSTQPVLTGSPKKTADFFELGIGGKKEEQLAYAQKQLNTTLAVTDVFSPSDLVDVHAVTKGKGTQGPVRRFGVTLRHHKSEKSIRNPGSLGAIEGQGHQMYRVAHAGKMGYHLRTEFNKKILYIDSDVAKVNPVGGIPHYGVVKTQYLLIKGSVAGTKKRLIRFNIATRPNKQLQDKVTVEYISTEAIN